MPQELIAEQEIEAQPADVPAPGRRKFVLGLGALAAGLLAGGGLARQVEPAAAARDKSLPSRDEFFEAARQARARQLAMRGLDRPASVSDAQLADLGYAGLPRSAPPPPTLAPPAAGETALAPPPSHRLEEGNVFLRMQADLQRALKKPVAERRWVMVIDLRKCVGCHACPVACKAENGLPPGVVYRPVIEMEIGDYPHVTRRFLPRPCMQCDNPPCVPVCPVGATYKRPDGIIEIDYNACIGCRYCMTACPYGARYFDFGDYYSQNTPGNPQAYETSPAPEYGRRWERETVEGVVRKCQFCLHRLNAGMLPACVTTCIGVANYFGDANDEESLVHELLDTHNMMRLKEDLGTEPKVYYLL